MQRSQKSDFATALRKIRLAKHMTQEDFDEVSSRVYISALERGVKQPTLPKVDALAARLGVHPMTLLVLSYCRRPGAEDVAQVLEQVLSEVEALVGATSRP